LRRIPERPPFGLAHLSAPLAKFLLQHAVRLAAQSHNLFRHLQHLLVLLQFVVRSVDGSSTSSVSFARSPSLSQLRFTFTLHGSLSPSVEQVIPKVNTKGAEIAGQEWTLFLVAVPAERLHIGDPNICLGQPDCSLRFLHFGTSF